jgi:outer membrane protein OmpA-like peptidoglycan-associated protein
LVPSVLFFFIVIYLRYIRSGAALLVVAAGAVASANAQGGRPRVEDVAFRFGVIGGATRNTHETEATVFNGGAECGAFNDGTGNGYVAGLTGEFPLLRPWLDLAALATVSERGGEFGQVVTGGLPVLDPNTDTYTELRRRHSYSAQLRSLVAELGVRITPIESVPLYVRATTAIALPIAPTFAQREEILSPVGVLYPETNTAERDVASGAIDNTSQFAAVAGTIGYDLPLGTRLTAAPEISYYYPLGDVTSSYRWRVATLQGALALKYSFGGVVQEPIVEVPPQEPVEAAPEPLASELAPSTSLALTQTVVTETFPILPYIFFDAGSATLSPRYARLGPDERAGFREESLPRRSLDAYYQLLNIVGHRLDETAGARITLKGTADLREEKVPGAANNLARARAQAVKDYLVKTWQIDPKRIDVVTSDRPTHPSSTVYEEGWHENRRVEISSMRDDVLRPILHRRFNEYTVTPSAAEFSGRSSGPIDAWQMKVIAGGEVVWEQEEPGAPPERLTWPIDDRATERIGEAIGTADSLRCELTLYPKTGEPVTRTVSIPATRTLQPYEVSRLSLIVFDFDRADINEQNRRMVSSFVSGSIAPSSTATITGSTDRLGEADHNRELSQSRAEAVRDLIVAERPTATITRVEGIGPSKLPYNNDLPEGRYYCRTVAVEVMTPIINAASAE